MTPQPTNDLHPAAPARPVRRVLEHWVVEATLELASPTHIGGPAAAADSEQPLLRDGQGRPYLPGTSLAGVFRSLLSQSCTKDEVEALLGHDTDTREGQGSPSCLRVDDATLLGEHATELRQGVQLAPDTGIAEDKKLYDIELLATGCRFRLHLELEALEGASGTQAVAVLLKLMKLIEQEGIQLGKRTRRGYGEVRLIPEHRSARKQAEPDPSQAAPRWYARRYSTASRKDLLAWLMAGREHYPDLTPFDCLKTLCQTWALDFPADWVGTVNSTRFVFTACLASSLLIRSGGVNPLGADAEHLKRLELKGGTNRLQPILSGTSLAGVLRQQCLKIATTLGTPASASELVDTLFGRALDQQRGTASRLRVSEAPITGGQVLRHTRVRIDPWTGGALETALFTHDAHYGGRFQVMLTLTEPHASLRDPTKPEENHRDACAALLLLALRDLICGLVPVGGEGSAGRGILKPPEDGFFLRVRWSTRPDPDRSPEGEERIGLDANGVLRLEDPATWQRRLGLLKQRLDDQKAGGTR